MYVRVMALTADILTAARGLIAFTLIASLAERRLTATAVLISLAWLTDLLDGRVARAGSTETRLGNWDLEVDTLVGAAVLVGLQMGGAIPSWLMWGTLLLLGIPFLILRRPTLAMALQAIAYASLLKLLWTEAGTARWLPPITIAAIMFIDFERFRTITLPAFFSGFLELLPQRGGEDQ